MLNRRYRIKRMVTDRSTGERTAMVTGGPNGSEWTLSAEERADKERAKSKGQRKQADLERFRRAIS